MVRRPEALPALVALTAWLVIGSAAEAQVASPLLGDAARTTADQAPQPPADPYRLSDLPAAPPDPAPRGRASTRGVPSTASVSLESSIPQTDHAPAQAGGKGPVGPANSSVGFELPPQLDDNGDSVTAKPVPARNSTPPDASSTPPSSAPINGGQRFATVDPQAPQPTTGAVDSATLRRIAERLVSLNLLGRAEDAQDPALLLDALRAFQVATGIAPTGNLDRDTIGRLLS
ncbi:hypothetical protein [Novosphingobium cyanobacteriorum]|uniref:Peptidoglycan binding-like domain-containing protein n=1 Tax=Novosphingobium cyanobacteriorum TaxID=3024215 RepID=A0ABT6CLB7_9SPHN|nr:hypothetical protein [Novosphingobium cyanobacteriorum]MDF8334358.1 hypothetical protein [Novosphingobium cyanobacteriorum]